MSLTNKIKGEIFSLQIKNNDFFSKQSKSSEIHMYSLEEMEEVRNKKRLQCIVKQ